MMSILDDIEVPERAYIAKGLRRPTLEYLNPGTEVFIVAKVSDARVSILMGEPSVSVEVGRLGSGISGTTVPLCAVTVASHYAPADELRSAQYRLALLEQQLADITAVVDEHPCPDWHAAVERVRAIVHPAPDEDEEP